jgi:hypothetical protein
VAIRTTDIVAPVFAAPEIVSLLLAGMTPETSFRNLFRRLVLKRDDLFGIAFFDVGLTWPVARFAAGHPVFPATYVGQLGVGRVREDLKLILVTILACVTADIVCGVIGGRFSLGWSNGLRRTA